MVGAPWFSTKAEHKEFAEKPNKGRFLPSQSSCLADFDVRHTFWRFDAIPFRLLEDNSTAVDLICSYLCATVTSCSPNYKLLLWRRLRLEDVAQTDQVVANHMQAKYTADIS